MSNETNNEIAKLMATGISAAESAMIVEQRKMTKYLEDMSTVSRDTKTKDNPEVPDILLALKKTFDSVEKIKGTKGNLGDKGDKGIKGDTGNVGIKGNDGKDGKNGTDGKDAPTLDKQQVVDGVVEQLPQAGKAIRDALELLPEGERLYISAIESKKGRGLDKIIEDLYKRVANKVQHIGGSVRMWITEEDGNPDFQTNRIRFPNGSVTQNADSTVSVNITPEIYTSDLSSQTNGALKVFVVPAHTRVISVTCTDFPIIYRPTVDFTTSGTTLTLTSQVQAPTLDATLLFTYIV